MVDQYNFGGGDLGPGGGSLQHPDGRHKTKKEIMEDIIAKSKMYKVGGCAGVAPFARAAQRSRCGRRVRRARRRRPLRAGCLAPPPCCPSPIAPSQALKAKQREEDEAYQERLDTDFKGLLEGQSLARLLKAPGENKWGAPAALCSLPHHAPCSVARKSGRQADQAG
jgi:hypothetical protein